MIKFIILFLTAFILLGCANQGALESLKPVCEALGDPIKYNPDNKNSPYHAGSKLADRIDQQDQVGANLNCNGY
jgi:hypothetical protein